MRGFLDYLQGESILHRMHPLSKIFVAALLCASAFVTTNFFYLLGIILFDILLGVIHEKKPYDNQSADPVVDGRRRGAGDEA